MNTLLIGINHKTAPIDIRERLFLSSSEQDLLLSEFRNSPQIIEAIVLSTCNRTEIYASVIDGADYPSEILIQKLFSIKNLKNHQKLKKCFYIYENSTVVKHLFEVATGLDSMVIGESQILGQLKRSFDRSKKYGMLWKQFNVLTNMANQIGKKVRAETNIGFGGVSVSWAAVNLAEKKLGSLANKNFLIIGAGKMGELTGSALLNKGFSKIYVMNRTYSIALELAKKLKATPVGFWELKKMLSLVDICICSVGAPHYIIEKEIIHDVLKCRKKKPLSLIDISVPRSISPEVQNISNIDLMCIDQLDQMVEDNMLRRKQSISAVCKIVEKKCISFQKKIDKIDLFEKKAPQRKVTQPHNQMNNMNLLEKSHG